MSLPEILLIDKPAGMTSFDVIRILRRQTGVRKFGHAGTLDPAATGLLVLGVGPGTKKLTGYQKLDKVYETTIYLGIATDTSDQDGVITQTVPSVQVTEAVIKQVLLSLVGTHVLPVSAYSAIKQNGVPLYKRARTARKSGTIVHDVPFRSMTVYQANFHSMIRQNEHLCISCTFHVGSGTYIRSLAEEVGRRLGYPAHVAALRRTTVGPFRIADAQQLTAVTG